MLHKNNKFINAEINNESCLKAELSIVDYSVLCMMKRMGSTMPYANLCRRQITDKLIVVVRTRPGENDVDDDYRSKK